MFKFLHIILSSLAITISLTANNLLATEDIKDYKHNPCFFKLTDAEGQESFILLTQHNLPLDILHPSILKIFDDESKVNKVSCEWKIEASDFEFFYNFNAYDHEAYKDTNGLSLPEEIYTTFQISKFHTLYFKPWAIFAYYHKEKQRSEYRDSMDLKLYERSKVNGYTYEGLETQDEVIQTLKLPDLSREQVLELFRQEGERTITPKRKSEILCNCELYRKDFKRREKEKLKEKKSYLSGDLIQVEEDENAEKVAYLNIGKWVGDRTEFWVPRIVSQHKVNKGKVFFPIGLSHGLGLRGLLYQLKSYFSIKRLTSEGLFSDFEYVCVGESLNNAHFTYIDDDVITAAKILKSLSPHIIQGTDFPEDKVIFLENLLHSISEMGTYEKDHLIWLVESCFCRDQSLHAQNTLSFLNSSVGKVLQEHLWGESPTLSFVDVIKRHQATKKLFISATKEPEKAFRSFITSWVFDQVRVHMSLGQKEGSIFDSQQPKSGWDEMFEFSFQCSKFKDVCDILKVIDRYCDCLSMPLNVSSGILNRLIKEGCFSSESHFLNTVLPLANLTPEEIQKLCKPAQTFGITIFPDISSLHKSITQYLSRKEAGPILQSQFFEEKKQEINNTLQKAESTSPTKGEIIKALELCVEGKKYYHFKEDLFTGMPLDVDEADIVIFEPDYERAKSIYEHGIKLFGSENFFGKRMARIMAKIEQK